MELLIKREYPKEKPKKEGAYIVETSESACFYSSFTPNATNNHGVEIPDFFETSEGDGYVTHFYEPISVEEVAKEQVIKELENLSNEISSIEYKYGMLDNVLLGIRRAKIEITARLNQLKSAK